MSKGFFFSLNITYQIQLILTQANETGQSDGPNRMKLKVHFAIVTEMKKKNHNQPLAPRQMNLSTDVAKCEMM